jgi:hypothetical protein
VHERVQHRFTCLERDRVTWRWPTRLAV